AQQGTWNVTVNAALPAGANTIGAVTQASGPWTSNVTQWAGTAVSVNSGTKDAGTLRVVIATDQPALTNLQPVNLTQVGGTTVSTGNGTAGADCPRVTIASDNSDVPVKLQPQASGGTTPYSYITSGAANQDSANVKGSAGQVYSYSFFNTTSSGKYVKLY